MTARTEGEILRGLLDLRRAKDELDQAEDDLWGRFFALADKRAGADEPYRFRDNELGMVIARSFSESARVDAKALEGKLTEKQWRDVTELVRVLDAAALDVAVRRGNVSATVVEECTERKRTAKRLLHHATKDELKAIAAIKAAA